MSEFWLELEEQLEHLNAKDIAHVFWWVYLREAFCGFELYCLLAAARVVWSMFSSATFLVIHCVSALGCALPPDVLSN